MDKWEKEADGIAKELWFPTKKYPNGAIFEEPSAIPAVSEIIASALKAQDAERDLEVAALKKLLKEKHKEIETLLTTLKIAAINKINREEKLKSQKKVK